MDEKWQRRTMQRRKTARTKTAWTKNSKRKKNYLGKKFYLGNYFWCKRPLVYSPHIMAFVCYPLGLGLNKPLFIVINFTEKNLQVRKNVEMGHFSDPAPSTGCPLGIDADIDCSAAYRSVVELVVPPVANSRNSVLFHEEEHLFTHHITSYITIIITSYIHHTHHTYTSHTHPPIHIKGWVGACTARSPRRSRAGTQKFSSSRAISPRRIDRPSPHVRRNPDSRMCSFLLMSSLCPTTPTKKCDRKSSPKPPLERQNGSGV